MSTTIILLSIPTIISIVLPQVATILGYIGSVAGLVIVYILPVITYLKKLKTELENPLLAKALDKNMYKVKNATVIHSQLKIINSLLIDHEP